MRVSRFGLAALFLALSAPAWAATDPEPAPSPADAELRREMAGWLSDIRENAGGAKEFLLDQAPLVVRDLVAMGRAEMTLWLVGWILSLAMACWSVRRFSRLVRRNWEDADEPTAVFFGFGMFGLCIWAVVSLTGIACCLHGFITAWFAPRIFVIEYVADMLGTMHGGK